MTPRANNLADNIFLRNVYSGLTHEYFRFEPCCPVVIIQISPMVLFLLDERSSPPKLSACFWAQALDIPCTQTCKINSAIRHTSVCVCTWPSTNIHIPLEASVTGTIATVQEEENKTYLKIKSMNKAQPHSRLCNIMCLIVTSDTGLFILKWKPVVGAIWKRQGEGGHAWWWG